MGEGRVGANGCTTRLGSLPLFTHIAVPSHCRLVKAAGGRHRFMVQVAVTADGSFCRRAFPVGMEPKTSGTALDLRWTLLGLMVLVSVASEALLWSYIGLVLYTVRGDGEMPQKNPMLYGQPDKKRRDSLNLQDIRSRVVVRPDDWRFVSGWTVSTVDANRAMSCG